MMHTKIKDIYNRPGDFEGKNVTVAGWARFVRAGGAVGFIELNDGSFFKNLQIVFESKNMDNYGSVASQNVGASFVAEGKIVMTPELKQPFEMHAVQIEIAGASAPDYPLQKKRHSPEFLREIAHLRPRANLYSAVFKIRSAAAFAVHKFFNERNFAYVHTPIITASDSEGAGEMFRVTTMDPTAIPKDSSGGVDFSRDFFNRAVGLTVSGQLEAEAFAHAFGKVYTFGPTFRAENSNTPLHAAEFWMIEPEMAFADLSDNMDLAEEMVKRIIGDLISQAPAELEFLNNFIDKGLMARLESIAGSEFARVTYTEAIAHLSKRNEQFEYKPEWGCDLQTEHERYLSEQVMKRPVFVTDYPKEIKSFYMRLNDDGKTVAAMDLLAPGIGELIGGSMREERLDYLERRIAEMGMDASEYVWYLDLRRYGGVRHSGFGLGFERAIMYMTGIANIRDVLPFPRTAGNAELP